MAGETALYARDNLKLPLRLELEEEMTAMGPLPRMQTSWGVAVKLCRILPAARWTLKSLRYECESMLVVNASAVSRDFGPVALGGVWEAAKEKTPEPVEAENVFMRDGFTDSNLGVPKLEIDTPTGEDAIGCGWGCIEEDLLDSDVSSGDDYLAKLDFAEEFLSLSAERDIKIYHKKMEIEGFDMKEAVPVAPKEKDEVKGLGHKTPTELLREVLGDKYRV